MKKKTSVLQTAGQINIREYKFYVINKCINNYYETLLKNDIISKIFEEKNIEFIYLLDNKINPKESLNHNLKKEDIHYIYFSEFLPEYYIMLIQHYDYYYFIRTIMGRPAVTIGDNFLTVIKSMSNAELKAVKLTKFTDLQKKTKIKYNNDITYSFDLINTDINVVNSKLVSIIIEEKKLNKDNDFLMLNNIYVLSDEHFRNMPVLSHIKRLSIINNTNITDLSLLYKCFPNLEELALWSVHKMTNESFNNCHNKLTTLEIHNCNIDINILTQLNSDKLTKLVFDMVEFKCQKNQYDSLLTEEQWTDINIPNLKSILINSNNLTKETIKKIVDKFELLDTFVVSQKLLNEVIHNTKTGYEKQEITFFSFESKDDFHKLNRDIKFINLKVNIPLYSESFLNIMKSRNVELVEVPKVKNPAIKQYA